MEKLKILREDKGLTQEKIADILGIERSTYSSYEIERDTFPIMHLNNLCNYFDVSLDYILDLTSLKNYKDYKKDINQELLSVRLKEFRKIHKFTQEDVAKYFNIARSTWTGYEYGNYLISTLILYEIAKKFNISIDYMLGKVDINYLDKS